MHQEPLHGLAWTEFIVDQSTSSGPIVPAVPVAGTPNGSLANPTPEYQWPAVIGATRYAIEIQHNGLIRAYDETIDASTSCSAGNCQFIKPDAARAGQNRWRLRAGSTTAFSGVE